MSETIEVLPSAPAPEVTTIVQSTGYPIEQAQSLQVSFAHLFQAARDVLSKSRAVEVRDVGQKLEMKLAREYRLELKRIRCEADRIRKALKEDSLRRGRAVDGFYNILVDLTDSEEKRLDEQEKFAEREEAKRKAALVIERSKLLSSYNVDVRFIDLGNMPEADFDAMLASARSAFEAMKEAARRAEEERQAKLAAEQEARRKAEEEAARVRAENERLRKEAEERERLAREEREKLEAAARAEREKAEAAAKAERERLEAIARAEREAKEKLEREAQAEREAKEKRNREEAEAARQAALAPDREKLKGLSNAVYDFASDRLPSVSSSEAALVVDEARARLVKISNWISQEAQRL